MAEQQKTAAGAAEAEAIDLGEFSGLLEKDFKVKKDVWPAPGTAPATGIAALPAPLSDVAQLLPPGSSALAICTTLAGAVAPPQGQPAPLAIDIFAGLHGQLPTQPDGSDADIHAQI